MYIIDLVKFIGKVLVILFKLLFFFTFFSNSLLNEYILRIISNIIFLVCFLVLIFKNRFCMNNLKCLLLPAMTIQDGNFAPESRGQVIYSILNKLSVCPIGSQKGISGLLGEHSTPFPLFLIKIYNKGFSFFSCLF